MKVYPRIFYLVQTLIQIVYQGLLTLLFVEIFLVILWLWDPTT